MTQSQWYYVTAEKTQQAFSEEQIPSLLADGTIQSGTLIWNGTMPNWMPAGEVKPEWFQNAGALSPQATVTHATVQPPPQFPPTEQQDPMALASLVCGIMAIALVFAGCMFPCLGIFGLAVAVPAVITGHIALGNIKRGKAPAGGRGQAVAGLIMGYCTLALIVVGAVLAALGVGIAALAGSGIPYQQ
ncbi:MAG: DUF4190 domain-containing protein [Verrucomicrobiales bacterium]